MRYLGECMREHINANSYSHIPAHGRALARTHAVIHIRNQSAILFPPSQRNEFSQRNGIGGNAWENGIVAEYCEDH